MDALVDYIEGGTSPTMIFCTDEEACSIWQLGNGFSDYVNKDLANPRCNEANVPQASPEMS